jgi:hypothetical protein
MEFPEPHESGFSTVAHFKMPGTIEDKTLGKRFEFILGEDGKSAFIDNKAVTVSPQ